VTTIAEILRRHGWKTNRLPALPGSIPRIEYICPDCKGEMRRVEEVVSHLSRCGKGKPCGDPHCCPPVKEEKR